MRIEVEHHSRYRFTEAQARVVQLLRLFPDDTVNQTVVSWRIDVDCDARLRESRDGYGNLIRMLYAEGPLETIGITVSGEVLLAEQPRGIEAEGEPLPPAFYRRTTSLSAADEAVAAFAQAAAGDGEARARLDRLTGALRRRFAIERRDGDGVLSAADAFARERLSPRDLAQLLVGCIRAIDLPARYVSGYSLDGCDRRERPAPHGWAEAFVEGHGWLGLDPSTGAMPGRDHVRVAVALDSAGAAPISGTRIGAGDEQLDVDVAVERLSGEG
ncbi:transglutaminase N-terminal domain-containing protein [Sphingomonas sp. ac-8]|uniref:transglutaminase family protein n=1 Tax=Sphingomonas sp. ac-8 TaxID=3242977 RepID=UPI003A802242